MDPETETTWWKRRLAYLATQIAHDAYDVPAEAVAEAILHGRPKWGHEPVFLAEVAAGDHRHRP